MFVIASVKWVPCCPLKTSFTSFLGRMNVCDLPFSYLVLRSLSGVVPQVRPCPLLDINPVPVYHFNCFGIQIQRINMSLTPADKKVVIGFWGKVGSQANTIGVNALGRWVQPRWLRRWGFIPLFHFALFSTAVAQVAAGVPADQDLLFPLERPFPQLWRCQEARRPPHGWSDRGHWENGQSDHRTSGAQWAARLHPACWPRQLQGMSTIFVNILLIDFMCCFCILLTPLYSGTI